MDTMYKICKREVSNPKGPMSVAVIKLIGGESTVIDHVPRTISALCSLFIRRGGVLKCCVDGSRRYSADLPQGGVEIPCKLIYSTRSAVDCEKLKKQVLASTITEVRKDVDKANETDEGIEWAESRTVSTIIQSHSEKVTLQVENQLKPY